MLARVLRPLRHAPLPSRQPHNCRGLAAAAAAGRQAGRADRYAGIVGGGQAHDSSPPPPRSQQQSVGQQPYSPPPSPLAEPSVLASRQWLLRLVPLQQFKAVGVSFDDRQSLIPALHKDQAVACVREPENPFDPRAVSIRTLDDRSLGHIPRDQTHHFLQDLCFGAVHSVGQQGEQGLWGFSVVVQPTIPPVEVLALPEVLPPPASLAHAGGLTALLDPEAWAAARVAVLAAAQGRCSVTGTPLGATAAEAAVTPKWRCDDGARVLRLAGFRVLAPEVAQVERLLELPEGGAEAAASAQLLCQLNLWGAADASLYLQHARQLQQQRSTGQPWRLDLRWLVARGVPIPPELAPLYAP